MASRVPHPELTHYLESAKQAALKAASVLVDWKKKFTIREKGRFDLITEADLAAQRTICDFLAGHYPSHAFLAEEGDAAKRRPSDKAPPTWIIDPIDGTTNYVHDCPMYCISIGLQVAGELVVGVVYEPSRREMFAAAIGIGAYLNDRPLKTSVVGSLDQAMLATGFPPDIRKFPESIEWWRYFSHHAQSMRRTGSTALNLSYVAAGRFDGFYAFDNHVWDVAGAVVVVREAGGTITNLDGSEYDPFTPDSLASNGPLHPALLQAIQEGPELKD